MIRLMARNCQEREHATESDLDEMVRRETPTTPASKCLRACIMESLALVCFVNLLRYVRIIRIKKISDTKWKVFG